MSETITVEGMTCQYCDQTVEDAPESVGVVTSATADRETETATAEDDADVTELVAAVDDTGYDDSA